MMAAYVVGRRGTTRQVGRHRPHRGRHPHGRRPGPRQRHLAVAGHRPGSGAAVVDGGQRRAAGRVRPGAAVPPGGARAHRAQPPPPARAATTTSTTTTTARRPARPHPRARRPRHARHDPRARRSRPRARARARPSTTHARPSPRARTATQEPAPFRKAWLVLMGVAGGLVPTPSALVVLLGAIALHRTWFGVLLVALYGLGMAGALMGAGLLLVRLQGWLERHWYATPRAAVAPALPARRSPPASSSAGGPLHRPAGLGAAVSETTPRTTGCLEGDAGAAPVS